MVDDTIPTRDPEIDADGEIQARGVLVRRMVTGRQMGKLEFLRWLYPRLIPDTAATDTPPEDDGGGDGAVVRVGAGPRRRGWLSRRFGL